MFIELHKATMLMIVLDQFDYVINLVKPSGGPMHVDRTIDR